MQTPPCEKLIIALDLPDIAAAQDMVMRLGDSVVFYKIGMELIYGGGLDLVRRLKADGKRVFVDLKLHDIPNTVARATMQIARLGADFLTIHAYPQTMQAAQAALGDSGLQLLAVTMMTSFNDEDARAAGYGQSVAGMVALRAQQAREAGVAGLILSAAEVPHMRAALGPDMLLVTPGIRMAENSVGDQKRVMTPAGAIAAGADYLVVGRPVIAAGDPRAAAMAILADIGAGHATKTNAGRTSGPARDPLSSATA